MSNIQSYMMNQFASSAAPVALSKGTRQSKTPPSAFVLFCRDYRFSITTRCPRLKGPEVTALLSHLWKTLDAETKAHYKNEASCYRKQTGISVIEVPQAVSHSPKEKQYFPLLNPTEQIGQINVTKMPVVFPMPCSPPSIPLSAVPKAIPGTSILGFTPL